MLGYVCPRHPGTPQIEQRCLGEEEGGSQPIGFVFLLVGIIGEKDDSALGYLNARWDVVEQYVGEFVHQGRALANSRMRTVQYDNVNAVLIQGHSGPTGRVSL